MSEQHVMNIFVKNDKSKCVSIVFDDLSREDIIRQDVLRVIQYVQGKITEDELDADNLCPEVLATLEVMQ